MAAALAEELRTLEALTFEELVQVRVEDVETAAVGLAQYAEKHFKGLLPVSAEQPLKVAQQIKDAADLDIPAIYASALASGSNWWQTDVYRASRGRLVSTAEADMMIEKAYFFYEKHMAVRATDLSEERDGVIDKMLNAKHLHEEMHRTKATEEIPKYARKVERWPAYLKLLGRSLPYDKTWDAEWFHLQREGFHAAMQGRKLGSGCAFYAILSKALLIRPSLVCAETNEDVKYGVGMTTVEALRLVTTGASTARAIAQGGENVLGLAHHEAALISAYAD